MKKTKDIITEEDYTLRTASANSTPDDDSPGDSESDAGAEFQMGIDFMPENAGDDEDDELDGLTLSNTVDLEPKNQPRSARQAADLPESAKVVSSNQPSPWMDIDAPSDTN